LRLHVEGALQARPENGCEAGQKDGEKKSVRHHQARAQSADGDHAPAHLVREAAKIA
jgi:hypothetical protein